MYPARTHAEQNRRWVISARRRLAEALKDHDFPTIRHAANQLGEARRAQARFIENHRARHPA